MNSTGLRNAFSTVLLVVFFLHCVEPQKSLNYTVTFNTTDQGNGDSGRNPEIYKNYTKLTSYNIVPYMYKTDLITLEVKSCANQFIMFSKSPDLISDMFLDIGLTVGTGGYYYILRRKYGITILNPYVPGLLVCNQWKAFWLSYKSGRIRMGKGDIIGNNTFLDWTDPEPIDVAGVGVLSAWGSTGEWRFRLYACYFGTFGENCTGICNCVNQTCNPTSGVCPPGGCQPGYMGDNCSTATCYSGSFGSNYSRICNCINQPCHPISGVCPAGGCQPGYMACYSGSFGSNCSGICNCVNQPCHPISGVCPPGGCQPGYMGDNCTTECSTGNFGFSCNESCVGCLFNSCNRKTGICSNTTSCKPGWQPGNSKCNIACYSGSFGSNCSGICNCLNQPCHPISGVCPPGGCQPGYMGDNCTTECSTGNFGFNCNESCVGCLFNSCNGKTGICSNTMSCKPGWQPGNSKCNIACYSGSFGSNCSGICNCVNQPCHPISGVCPPGGCQPGYMGDNCTTACYSGSFGSNCSGICNCVNQPCHPISGVCPPGGCQPGYMGDNCTTECSTGNFGFSCNESCVGCLFNSCNGKTGICSNTTSCKPGWQPGNSKCNIACYSGSFGSNCSGICNCVNQPCHPISGVCPPGGCQPGYMGDNCTTECSTGNFGFSCNESCVGCLFNSCNGKTGVCSNTTSCKPGWQPGNSKCNIACYSGSFGSNCSGICNCVNQPCHPISGVCPPGGCQPGYMGDNCTTACYSGSFGSNCSGICNCVNQPCQPISGVCPPGGCQPGYMGDNCTTECSTGNYGFNCNESCVGCLLNSCNGKTGVCSNTTSCKPGWQPGNSKCNIACYSGSFGSNCLGICQCLNQPCHPISGVCPPGGCQPGYMGDNCTTACYSGYFGSNCSGICNCVNQPCHPISGVCPPGGCQPGYMGDNCTTECSTGNFGFNCNESCVGCLLNSCNGKTGVCSNTTSCKPGWQPGNSKCNIACYSASFGSNCSGICHCLNQPCHPISGVCPPGGCQPGYMGDNCTTACYSGSFGSNCSGICHCLNQPCHPISGVCPPAGCQPGYMGDNCTTACYSGSFGSNCSGICNCVNQPCQPISGVCPPGGCQPGYMGDNCTTECTTGNFGFNCNESCVGCLLNSCNGKTGICSNTTSCKPGWQPGNSKCNTACYSGFFGSNCSAICHCLHQPCNPISGACPPGGCQPGYMGDNCTTECSTGHFGFNCNESCVGCLLNSCEKETGLCTNTTGCKPGWQPGNSKCDIECNAGLFGKNCAEICSCINQTCDHVSGVCPLGRCQPGYKGDNCSTECDSGLFGNDCAEICHCINQPCNHVSGVCPLGGCQRGYKGDNCSTECSTGTFGFNCNESCVGCLLNSCAKETGVCTNTTGCTPGWQPGNPKCNTACYSGSFGRGCAKSCHCVNQPCHHIFGICPLGGCEPGYEGDTCLKVSECIVSPSYAVFGEKFNITCLNYTTYYEDILFALYIPDFETGEIIYIANSVEGMFTDISLPAGKMEKHFMYNIQVHIDIHTEIKGFEIVKNCTVMVLDSLVNKDMIKNVAENIMNTENQALAAEFINVVLQLNMTKSDFAEITEVLSEHLSDIEYKDGFSVFNPVSNAVNTMLTCPERLSQKTVDNLVDCLYKLSTYYTDSSVPEMAATDKISFVVSLFQSSSTIYDLTVDNSETTELIDTNNAQLDTAKNEKLKTLVKVVENLADGFLNAMNNEMPDRMEFVTNAMNIFVGAANNSEETIVNSSREINNKTLTGSIQIPILVNSSLSGYKFQMLFTEKLPFSSSSITTPMLSLKVKDEAKMPLVDFPEPVIITLPSDINIWFDNYYMNLIMTMFIFGEIVGLLIEEELFTVYTWNSLCIHGVLNSDGFLRLYIDQPANQYLIVKLKLQMSIPILYAINMEAKVTFADAQNGTLLTDMFTAFVKDPEEKPFRWSIGLLFAERECRENVSMNVSVSSSAITCQYWNTELDIWSTSGCEVSPLSTGQQVVCKCNHLTHFAGGFLVLPNTIDPIADSLLFLTFFDNPVIVSTVILLWMIYLFGLVWARRADIKDTEFGITIPYPSNLNDPYKYMMCIVTGWRFKAGTSSNISCYIIGSKGHSAKHALSVHNRVLFQSGAEDWFLITSSFDLGEPTETVLWHDNSGASPSWFLSRVMIQDLQSTQVFNFFNENWLGEESGQSKVRLLSTSTQDLKRYFGSQIFLKTSQGLRSDHLWISIVSKPPRCEFTRAQRLSCALSLLLCTMLTCLMFHGIPSDDVIATNIAGFSFKISLEDIIIGIESGVIMFPVNLIIIQLFEQSKPKMSKRKESFLELINQNMTATIKQTGTECKHPKPIRNTRKMLPWWNLYIAWTVVILTSLTSSYFVMLYGLKYGYKESLQWLVSFLTGFLDDICVLEPLHVVFMAMIATCILRKPFGECPLIVQKSDALGTCGKTTNPFPRRQLKASKHQHELNAKLQTKVFDIILYILFMFVMLIVVHSHRSIELCYHQTKAVQEVFVQKEFENIRTHNHFWTYLNTSLIDRLQRTLPYDVTKKDPENDFYLLGKFRLRQLRVEQEICSFPGKLKKLFTVEFQCTSFPSLHNYDTRHYNKSWHIPVDAVLTSDEWTYQSAWDLESPPYIGIKSIYRGGGYVVELKPGMSSILKLSSLSKNLWIDAKTNVVIVEFNLYNPNVNLFSNVMMSVEADSHDNILPSYQILTAALFHYSNLSDKTLLILDLIFLLFTVLFTFLELKKIVQIGIKPYIKGFWNKLSVFQFVLCYTMMGVYVQRIISTEKILKIRRERGNEIFLNYSLPILWDCITIYVMAILVTVTVVKFLKLLTLNAKLNFLYSALKITEGPLQNFTIMFIVFFLAFVFTGNLLFGAVLVDFKSIGNSFMTLIGLTVRILNSFELIIELYPITGPIFLFLFIFTFVICLMPLFSVIVIDGVKTLHASKDIPTTTYTPLLLKYVVDSLKRIFR